MLQIANEPEEFSRVFSPVSMPLARPAGFFTARRSEPLNSRCGCQIPPGIWPRVHLPPLTRDLVVS